jgi:hypothetical protein
MADFTIVNSSEKLIVGSLDMSFLSASDKLTPGTAVINGPCYIGLTPQLGVARATCMIGPPLPGLNVPASLEVIGVTNFVGVTNTTGVLNDLALSNVLGFTNKIGAEIQSAFKAIFGVKTNNSVQITNGPKVCSAIATTPFIKADVGVFGDLSVLGPIKGICTGNKPASAFDLPFVKQKGKRVRHIVAEGPEPGIYIRGTLKDSNIIELPDYWDGLVDPETITVTLTQIGYTQDLIVDRIEWGKRIVIRSGVGANIHCYYEVWVSRWLNPMDHTEKLYVVYDGESPSDYPGNKESFLIGGWDYDRRETQWRTPQKVRIV